MSVKSCLDFSIVDKLNHSSLLINTKFKKLKIIHKYLLDTENSEDIPDRIFALNLKCAHKYTVNVESSFTAGNTLYLVLQYGEGGSLRDLINRVVLYEDILHESEIMDWFCQLVIAINHLNKNGLDLMYLNPRKVFFKNNNVKLSITEIIFRHLVDKNIKKIGDLNKENFGDDNVEENDDEEKMKYYHELYMSPEQLCSEEDPCNFDVSSSWSLGCILYELCSLKKLFKNKVEIISFKENPDEFNQHISTCSTLILPIIQDLFTKVMRYDPKYRLATTDLLKENTIQDYIQHSMSDKSNLEEDLEIKTSSWKINESHQMVHRCETNCENLSSDSYIDDVDNDCLTTDDINEIINSI